MNSWRGFHEIPELITAYLKLSRGALEVVLTGAITGDRGFGTIPTHARTIDLFSSNWSAHGDGFVGLLLLTRKGFWARLDVTYRFEQNSRFVVTRWQLTCMGHDSMKIAVAACGRGRKILSKFKQIMQETEDALLADLECQRTARKAYEAVLARLKF
ncbi:MAG: hypothetical protein G01um101448_244 [Parcubacteria group bacterium Gr01-1014_48]|nr:MAG: hypothetical protein Greene041614_72 [Parcubacteria group bacterium Greene0416_14]TSC74246.1 MAG: hypothetical protein G01um101448_244 [Parcubacteria group bacterium Gr01-1014_48]TSD01513.1 MAG: hypothetical protein Greene101415_229 [Parcubacteria group bacterium Greene1014_15]TSD08335.1 MAG: hypothetical protein Greene07144_186 [Parcubacteria group bacterium Greene0714_4]